MKTDGSKRALKLLADVKAEIRLDTCWLTRDEQDRLLRMADELSAALGKAYSEDKTKS